MKLSIYNTYLNISPKVGCIYNAMSNKTLVFYGDVNEIEKQAKIPPSLRDKFIEAGIVVDNNTDEYRQFIELAKKVENESSSYHLLLNPTLNCNFHCSYCYESHFASKMDAPTMSKVKKFIRRQLNEGKDLVISFFGGEPLLYYDDVMRPLIEYSKEEAEACGKKFTCNMTSNGYLLNRERVIWLRNNSFTHVQITLDGNRELHNAVRYRFVGDNTYDRILENIRLLAANGIEVTLRLNCTNSNFNSLVDIPNALEDLSDEEKSNIFVDIQVVWQESGKESLISRMDTIVDSFSKKGISAAKMDFSGFCYADRRQSSLVNFNGDVYKCTARDFHTTPRDGYLTEEGIIVWENYSLERRMQSKFKNIHCRTCRIFPLCHGGCSTNSLENDNYCMHNFDDAEKDRVVKDRIVRNSIFSGND